MNMITEDRRESSGFSPATTELWRELDLVLSFFDRVEGRFSLLFGIDVALLGILAAAVAPVRDAGLLTVILALIAALCVGTSISYVYRGLFPRTLGPMNSIVYFRSVRAYKEDDYVSAWAQATAEVLREDLARQVWRNSEILWKKFGRLKAAFGWTVIALVPCCAVLGFALWNRTFGR